MKINIQPVKNMFGKRNGSYVATFAGWQASDVDKPRAAERLQEKLQRHSDNLMRRRYMRANGATFALYYADGWCYDIIRDDSPEKASTSVLSCRSVTEATEQMKEHVRQWNECQ